MNQPKFSAYEMARQQLDAVAEKIHLDPNIHCALRDVRRCVELSFPVMSLGSGLEGVLPKRVFRRTFPKVAACDEKFLGDDPALRSRAQVSEASPAGSKPPCPAGQKAIKRQNKRR